VGQAGTCLGDERLACGGEAHLPRRTFEQAHAELLLQLADLLAEGWLPHTLTERGPAEVELLGEGDRMAQLLKIHMPVISIGVDLRLDRA
jgi:hypothetical protein